MISIYIDIDVKAFPSREGVRLAVMTALEDVARVWVDKYLPQHFQAFAAAKYQYRRRTEKYLKRKGRMAQQGIVADGGKLDLVFTGKLRQSTRDFVAIKVKPTYSQASVFLPNYARYRGLSSEVTRLTVGEESALNRRAGDVFRQSIQKHRQG